MQAPTNVTEAQRRLLRQIYPDDLLCEGGRYRLGTLVNAGPGPLKEVSSKPVNQRVAKSLISKKLVKLFGRESVNGRKVYTLSNSGSEARRQQPHKSHRMGKWGTEVLAPAGTPRFYSVRECGACGEQEWLHAAGHFLHGLSAPCRGRRDG